VVDLCEAFRRSYDLDFDEIVKAGEGFDTEVDVIILLSESGTKCDGEIEVPFPAGCAKTLPSDVAEPLEHQNRNRFIVRIAE